MLLQRLVHQRVGAARRAPRGIEDLFLDLRVHAQRLANLPGQRALGDRRRTVVAQRLIVDEQLLDRLVVGVQQVHRVIVGNDLFHPA